MKHWIGSTAWIAGLMTAPHSLALLGNLAGSLQWYLPLALAAALSVYWLNSTCLAAMIQHLRHCEKGAAALPAVSGAFAALLMLAAGRVITAVTAATVLLVTAGFAFNETFVYWFPNFGFAFVLLAVVLAVRLAGHRTAEIFQVFTSTIALGGLGLLIIMGLWAAPVHFETAPARAGENLVHPLFSVLLLFAGFDSALNHRFDDPRSLQRSMAAGMFLMAAVLGLWGAVSILHVPAQNLDGAYIPHILAAKAVAGDAGRRIMAMVVIVASCAAVNALFGNVSDSLDRVADRWRFSGHPAAVAVLCTLAVGAMMVTGMAGTDEIDVYVRAGLYTWLMAYGAVNLAVWRRINRQAVPTELSGKLQSAAGGLIMLVSFVALVCLDPDRLALAKFMSCTWAVLAVLFFCANFFFRFHRR